MAPINFLPSERLRRVYDVVREVLVSAQSSRLVTALAPALARNIDVVNLPKLQLELADVGLERRLAWLVDNTLEAIRAEVSGAPREIAAQYRRAEVVLGSFLEVAVAVHAAKPAASQAPDILDPLIRSAKTLATVTTASSRSSRRWNIITDLQPEDFAQALRGAS